MTRRGQRKGDWLATDDYLGYTRYASQLKLDFWGARAERPLKRNLQDIASPLNDPRPVEWFRAPNYETSIPCDYEVGPSYVGNTNIPTNFNNAAGYALNLDPGIGDMAVGCTFEVR